MISISQLDDVEEARELHDLAFPLAEWEGDDHTFWIARDDKGKTLAFASAIQWKDGNVFLSRCAVIAGAMGRGLQRRMIRVRLRWAKAMDAPAAVSYTLLRNYPSMVNLLRCGFRFYSPDTSWAGDGDSKVHYFIHSFKE